MATRSASTPDQTGVTRVGEASRTGTTYWPRQWAWGCSLVVGCVLITGLVGCNRSPSPPISPPESPTGATPAPTSTPTPVAAPETAPEPPTAPAPQSSPEPAPPTASPTPTAPVAQAPTTSVPRTPLPDDLVKQWEPMSNVLLAFGPMTITATDMTWGSGQTSPYTLVSTEDGFLLKLTANPSFYDTTHPYVKLIPKIDPSGAITGLEVAFYEGEAQAKQGEYMMYGSYF